MKLESSVTPFIEGTSFTDSLVLKIEQQEEPVQRMDYIEDLVRGKRVLHVGCLDHVPLIDSRLKAGRWFHGRLTEAASECLGVDIDREGVEMVRSKLGITNVHYCDITVPPKLEAIAAQTWDYTVFGEVVEHVDNPVHFLKSFADLYRAHVDRIVVTVPNAFRARNFRLAWRSIEGINSDHRYWFTPYTAWKVTHRAGLTVEAIQMCKFDFAGTRLRERIRDRVLRRKPLLAESIVVISRVGTQLPVEA